jgi:hypothetical protein
MSHVELGEKLECIVALALYEKLQSLLAEPKAPPDRWRALRGSLIPQLRRLGRRLLDLPNAADLAVKDWRTTLDVDVSLTMGIQLHPFHVVDSSRFLPYGYGAFTIHNRKSGATIRGGDLTPLLIHQACFFEGNVKWRIEPEAAVQVVRDL